MEYINKLKQIWQNAVNGYQTGVGRVLTWLESNQKSRELIAKNRRTYELVISLIPLLVLGLLIWIWFYFFAVPYRAARDELVVEITSITEPIKDEALDHRLPDFRIYGNGLTIVTTGTAVKPDLLSGKLSRRQIRTLLEQLDEDKGFWGLNSSYPTEPFPGVPPVIISINERTRSKTVSFTDNSDLMKDLVAIISNARPGKLSPYFPREADLFAVLIRREIIEGANVETHEWNTEISLAEAGGAGKRYERDDLRKILAATDGRVFGYFKHENNYYQVFVKLRLPEVKSRN